MTSTQIPDTGPIRNTAITDGTSLKSTTLNKNDEILDVTDSLTVDDPRRAIQLPQDVINSGLEANPRTK